MTAIFFDRFTIEPIRQLQATDPQKDFHFIKSQIVTRIVGLFASFVAFFEAIAQLSKGYFKEACWYLSLSLFSSVALCINPSWVKSLSVVPFYRVQHHDSRLNNSSTQELKQLLEQDPRIVHLIDQNGKTFLNRAMNVSDPNQEQISLLLEQKAPYHPDRSPITEEDVKKIFENRNCGPTMIALLLFPETRDRALHFLRNSHFENESDQRKAHQILVDYAKVFPSVKPAWLAVIGQAEDITNIIDQYLGAISKDEARGHRQELLTAISRLNGEVNAELP